MVEQRLEWESKSTETAQYIGKGKIETETGSWKQKQSVRGLKQNDEDWNVIKDLRGCSGISEGNDIVSEVLGVSQGLLSCQDSHPIAKIPSNPRSIPLPLPQLHSNHPPRFQHYTNQAPKLQPTPKTSNALSSLSENPKWPPRILTIFLSSYVFIILF